MKNDPLDINPPAIVKEADQSINELEAAIIDDHGHQQRHQAHSLEFARRMGQKLLKLKERLPYGQFEGRIEKKMPFKMRQAQKYMRLAREWDKLTEAHSGALLSINDATRFLIEEVPEEAANGTTGSVPFQANGHTPKPPAKPTEREPGDETQHDETAAKIEAALCPRCKRIGTPGCDPCRAKAFKIQSGIPLRNSDGTKPAPRDHPLNGTIAVDWAKYRKLVTQQVAFIQGAFEFVDAEVSPVAEKYRARFEALLLEFKADWEKLAKEKVPHLT
jgi:hypothetical protein